MVLVTTGERRAPNARTADDLPNVGKTERQLSTLAGGALALMGLRRRGLEGGVLAALGAALVHRGVTGRCFVYEAAGINTAADHGRRDAVDANGDRHRSDVTGAAATVNARKAVKMERSITIARPRAEVYAFWRDFGNLSRFMSGVESVRDLGNDRTHWEARTAAGATVSWDAELVNDLPNELIAWKTVGDPDIAHAGSVHFDDTADGLGTVVRVVIDYEPPGGRIGAIGARLAAAFGESPDQRMAEDLERLRTLLEQG